MPSATDANASSGSTTDERLKKPKINATAAGAKIAPRIWGAWKSAQDGHARDSGLSEVPKHPMLTRTQPLRPGLAVFSSHSPCARFAAVLLLALLVSQAVAAQDAAAPRVPCGGPAPAWPAVEEPPTVRVWYDTDLPDWIPPACTGWKGGAVLAVVETHARFRHDGDSTVILARFARISAYSDVMYWSSTRGHWRQLIPEATALASGDEDDVRGDFSLDELPASAVVHYVQREETPADRLVYRLRVQARAPDRLVLALENARPVRRFVFQLFPAGGYRFLYFLEREAGDVWRYSSLVWMAGNLPGSLLRDAEASFVYRGLALFRHAVGIPTDRDPPTVQ